MSAVLEAEAEYDAIWNQNAQVGIRYYLLPEGSSTAEPPVFPVVLDLAGFMDVNVAYTGVYGTLTIQDVEPQTQDPVGSPVSVTLSGSGSAAVFTSYSGVVQVTVTFSGTPAFTPDSALTLIAL